MRCRVASTVRSRAFPRECLSLAKTCSMGFRSGLHGGRKSTLAPADLMAALAVATGLRQSSFWVMSPVIQEAYVQGVSARNADDPVKAMGASGVSKSQSLPWFACCVPGDWRKPMPRCWVQPHTASPALR